MAGTSFIEVGNTGKNLHTHTVTTADGTVHNEVVDMGMDYMQAIASGLVPGTSCVNKFGLGTVTGTEEIWDAADTVGDYTYMTTASTLYISSDDAGDGQVYEVQGLDANLELQVVEVTASGFNFVALDETWLRVFRAKNLGTTDNAGNIYISDDNTDAGGDGVPDTLANVKAQIGIGNNQTLMAIYTVPAGKTAYMTHWGASVGKGDDVTITLVVRPFGGVFQVKDHKDLYQTIAEREFAPYLKILEKEDIALKGAIGAAGGQASGSFDLILVDN